MRIQKRGWNQAALWQWQYHALQKIGDHPPLPKKKATSTRVINKVVSSTTYGYQITRLISLLLLQRVF